MSKITIETWYRCPKCNKVYKNLRKAECSHSIIPEQWAVAENGAALRINGQAAEGSMGSKEWALKTLKVEPKKEGTTTRGKGKNKVEEIKE